METLEEKTKQILKANHLYANKKLGQNFLINEEIIEDIVSKSEVSKDDLIIEIGPGLGSLTEALLKKAGRVVCVELDQNMIEILNKRFNNTSNFEIIHNDILKVDLNSLISERKKQYGLVKAKVVANLPYYITTPIIMKLLEEKLDITSITVMVQKEVAQRLTAVPGDEFTGAITYTINYYSVPSTIIDVPKENFMPVPEVDSSVIQLKILKEPSVSVEDENLFFEIIKCAFMQKRKTIINSLTNSKLVEKEKIKLALEKMGLDDKIRAEKLTIEQFARLTSLIK
ncbi:MAG: 16S rRNA (adenine(1518)-N(6)/adenine(1519)-N(6))-dimethyltransferase RsmA [Clostridia bacterium]|nr:16S rRNA (adenine(1518)-N(6)/adenine(1519)-N(6))-dimethyltransferase RsmA [Clostridia bacterium]